MAGGLWEGEGKSLTKGAAGVGRLHCVCPAKAGSRYLLSRREGIKGHGLPSAKRDNGFYYGSAGSGLPQDAGGPSHPSKVPSLQEGNVSSYQKGGAFLHSALESRKCVDFTVTQSEKCVIIYLNF